MPCAQIVLGLLACPNPNTQANECSTTCLVTDALERDQARTAEPEREGHGARAASHAHQPGGLMAECIHTSSHLGNGIDCDN